MGSAGRASVQEVLGPLDHGSALEPTLELVRVGAAQDTLTHLIGNRDPATFEHHEERLRLPLGTSLNASLGTALGAVGLGEVGLPLVAGGLHDLLQELSG